MKRMEQQTQVIEQQEQKTTPFYLEEHPPFGAEPSAGRPWRSRLLKWSAAAAIVAAAAVTGWKVLDKPAPPAYSTTEVRRGTLAKTISATGKVEAVTTVEVGTQVSGTVSELHADFNDTVKKGQLIARLDPSQYEAQLAQATANLLSAQARLHTAQNAVTGADAAVAAAKANVDRADAVLADAQRNFADHERMYKAQVIARQLFDSVKASLAQAEAQKQQAVAQYNQAVAQAQSSRSQLEQARAELTQSQASLQLAQVNLERTYIRAPIDGVVIARNVDVGQTVAASLSAPTLFLIANDLTKMQVLADVDEADVGQLSTGTKVTFTVDAFPDDTFHGTVTQVRLAPQVVQNVVTYTAVVNVDNPHLKLRPGMTANLTATVAEAKDALIVPNTALRFRPENTAPSPSSGGKRGVSGVGARGGGPVVWKVEADALKPVRVSLGLTDGVSTAVESAGLREGDRLATPAAAAGNSTTAPRTSFPGMGMRGGRR